MKRTIKRAAIGLGIFLLVLLLAAVVIAAFFQDAVGKKLIAELNKQLTTELTVGGFDLSLLRGFPNATATLRDVAIKGKFGGRLLEAGEMSFHFRLLSLFGPQVKVHSVAIRDGALALRANKQDRVNYDIFKPSETEDEGGFNLSLTKAVLANVELVYSDERLQQETRMTVLEADLAGEFSNKKYDLTSRAKLVSDFIDIDGVRYLAGKNLGFDAQIAVDVASGKYDFEEVAISIENNVFNIDGSVTQGQNFTAYDLTATAEDANLESVIALLPAEQTSLLGGFSSRGQFQFSTKINGRLSASERPDIEATLGLRDGKLTHPQLKEPFKDVSFSARFSNGDENSSPTSSFKIEDFKGYLDRELLTMALSVENLDDPRIDLQADGALPMGYIYGLFGNPAITGGSGEVEFRNVLLKGRYQDMQSMRTVTNVEMSGEIGFDDAALKVNGEEMTIDRGVLVFQNNLLSLDNLKLEGAGGEVVLQAKIENLLPVLFADSLNTSSVKLVFSGELFSPKIDLERWVNLTETPVKEGDVEAETFDSLQARGFEKREQFTDFLQGSFTAKIDAFRYGLIEGTGFGGTLNFQHSAMRIVGQADAMDGSFLVDGTVFFEKEPRLQAKLAGSKIDLKKFFYQSKDFGQAFLTSDNLAGTLNTKMLIQAAWDTAGNFLPDDLHVWAGLGVTDGELKGFKLLEEFSSYAKVSDLRHVVFTDMQNWVEVENSMVTLPAMFLQNNAMNLTVCGEQTFDDKIDYGIKVNAGQALANKFKRGNSKLQPIEAKKNGFFNLYFNVHGTLDDYDYETNKRKVKDMFARSEKAKQRIRAVLIREFGTPLNMLREPTEWGDEGEAASRQDDDDVEYIEGF